MDRHSGSPPLVPPGGWLPRGRARLRAGRGAGFPVLLLKTRPRPASSLAYEPLPATTVVPLCTGSGGAPAAARRGPARLRWRSIGARRQDAITGRLMRHAMVWRAGPTDQFTAQPSGRRACAGVRARSAPTCGAKSMLLIRNKSLLVTPRPVRGVAQLGAERGGQVVVPAFGELAEGGAAAGRPRARARSSRMWSTLRACAVADRTLPRRIEPSRESGGFAVARSPFQRQTSSRCALQSVRAAHRPVRGGTRSIH